MSTDEFVESIFSQLDQEARGQSPQGYPTDSGSFIGSSSYTLVSIGEQPVDGPTFKDSYHEQNWDGLSEEYPQQFEEENCEAPGGFYWLHYLNKKQAEKLGLLAPKNEAVGAHGDHPEWASRTFVENEDRSWVSTDMIFDSYSDGQLQVEPSKYAYIAIGCGKSWDPSSDPKENEEIDQDTGITEYPESSAPLLKIEIIRGSHDYPEELSRLLPYLKRFND
ncbi:MAG: hypothetical protein NTW02_08950 [Cyanobium sp. LacPavin_0920_WC12_MAG_62_9]|nr:hypothetical protein [Cyanobium sp. LacPavin_0920_WC12_MAG_62_9]